MPAVFEEDIKSDFFLRLDKLKPDTKPLWGKMTAVQMITHMNDVFRIALGMKPAVDKSNFYTHYIMFPAAVYLLPVWPKGEATAPEIDQLKGGSKPRDFYTEAEFLKKMMDIFNEREATKMKPHPLFGSLSKKQWRDLLVKHLNHHLKQFGV